MQLTLVQPVGGHVMWASCNSLGFKFKFHFPEQSGLEGHLGKKLSQQFDEGPGSITWQQNSQIHDFIFTMKHRERNECKERYLQHCVEISIQKPISHDKWSTICDVVRKRWWLQQSLHGNLAKGSEQYRTGKIKVWQETKHCGMSHGYLYESTMGCAPNHAHNCIQAAMPKLSLWKVSGE